MYIGIGVSVLVGDSEYRKLVGWVESSKDYLVSFASTMLRNFNIVLRGLVGVEAYLSGGLRGNELRFSHILIIKPSSIGVGRKFIDSLRDSCVSVGEYVIRDGQVLYDSSEVKGSLGSVCRSLLDSMVSAWHNLNVVNVFLAMVDPMLKGTPLIHGKIYSDGGDLVFDNDLIFRIKGMKLDIEYVVTPLYLDGEKIKAGITWGKKKVLSR